ncbi:hypothetical protein THRCLA_01672 [Thraustotheca clavata]|uniref:U2A'/phosphoprotein 32 family A C-terminal domain-containing protein n=1 Tax=Thraustotheca clavata TaxID=74557 RepID=A0A1W0A8E3_9STRA|nr:hypothetical protein THRCLA_01672 [Thraustotheca clavata]
MSRPISVDLLMELHGIYDIENMKELILRDETIDSLEQQCAKKMSSLELLSLSHNRLTSLEHFGYLTNLIELNVNFNRIESLELLQCFGLQKLYAANNCIKSITPLRSFPKLIHISVFGNELTDLEEVFHTCRHLLKLKSIDLDGNPCARIPRYKYHVIRSLPRLRTLDGDNIQALDRELCDVNLDTNQIPPAPIQKRRPTTPFENNDSLRGHVQLFRDEFLNNNPILLEYLAQSVQSDGVDENPPIEEEIKSAFVDRMRQANPDPSAIENSIENELVQTPPPVTPSAPVFTHSIVDPSDPKTTIRKLLKHIESLDEIIAQYKIRANDTAISKLLEENKQLQIENNNIPVLQQEIQELKRQLFARPSNSSDEVEKLKCENACLRRQITKFQTITQARARAPDVLTKEEILDEAASVDLELTEMILKNEISLELMRHSIHKTKLELQNERVAERVGTRRPMTSAGVGERSSGAPVLIKKTRVKSRAIHTSAGSRKSTLSKKSVPKTIKEESCNNHENNNADVLVL